MITLHGFSYSNYYNIVKHVLLHKDLPFEEDLQFGDAQEYLAISQLGKVPAITLADIYLRYVLSVVDLASGKLGRDFAAEISGLKDWRGMMADTDIARRIDADQEANRDAFFAYLGERYGI